MTRTIGGDLPRAAARGILFTMMGQGGKIALQLLSLTVLARLLSPHDYGLVAIVLVVVAFGEIFRDFGLTSASVQAETLSRGQRDNLFWINLGIGFALMLITWALSWPMRIFTGEPETLRIAQAMGFVFLLNGLATQHRAGLMRDLRFRALASTEVLAAAVGLVAAVCVAFAGGGYWSLVVQQLTTALVVVSCTWLLGRWLPKLPSREHSVRSMVSLGWRLVATNIVAFASSNADTLLVGTRFGTTSLGLYNRAFQVVMTPVGQVRTPATTIALPVLSRTQTDQPTFARYVVTGQLALGYGIGIPLALVAGLSEPVVHVVLGAQWLGAAPMVTFFAIAAMLNTLSFVGYWIYLARGLGSALFRYSLVSLAIKLVCILAGSLWGPVGVAAGLAVAPLLAWPLSLWWLNRVTSIPVRALYLGAVRILGLLLVIGVVAHGATVLVKFDSVVAQLALGIGTAAVVAGICLMVVPALRSDARSLLRLAKLIVRSRRRR